MNNRFTYANYDTRNQAFHFNDKLLTFTIYYFAFLCKPIWGTLVYYGIIVIYYRSPCLDIFLGTASPKIFRETVFPTFRVLPRLHHL